MKRAVVFAHYDKDNIIDDYVIYYLKSLKEICNKIIFVSACDIVPKEIQKLDNIADYAIYGRHDEYDFGSYKRGFLYLKENGILQDTESLIFANDSCYGPLFPLEDVFEKIDPCDFWGITKNKFGMRRSGQKFVVCKRPHIQSYFMVFAPQVFNSEGFSQFMQSVTKQELKNDIVINYEIGLYEFLTNLGFKSDFYIKDYYNFSNATILKWRQLLTNGHSPYIKCNLLRQVYNSITVVDDWREVIEKCSEYPTELIAKNLTRTMQIKSRKTKLPLFVKRIVFDIMAYFPNWLRRLCSIAIGRILKNR